MADATNPAPWHGNETCIAGGVPVLADRGRHLQGGAARLGGGTRNGRGECLGAPGEGAGTRRADGDAGGGGDGGHDAERRRGLNGEVCGEWLATSGSRRGRGERRTASIAGWQRQPITGLGLGWVAILSGLGLGFLPGLFAFMFRFTNPKP